MIHRNSNKARYINKNHDFTLNSLKSPFLIRDISNTIIKNYEPNKITIYKNIYE